jgi:hypothetical protein
MCRLLPVLLLALSLKTKAEKPGFSSYSIGIAEHNSAIYSLYTEAGTGMNYSRIICWWKEVHS